MPSDSLFRLWKLHQVDEALVEIRSRAAALDPGKKLMAELEALKMQATEAEDAAKALSGEQSDLELKQKGLDEKVKRFEKDLYGGKVVNPREIEAIQKEVGMLKAQRGELDGRILEIWDLLPPANEKLEAARREVELKSAALAEHQRDVLEMKTQLEKAFKEASAKRADVAAQVEKPLLARYDAIRAKQGGLGVSPIDKDGSCHMCGTLQPRKTVEMVKEDRVVTCEACHRILVIPLGLR